jgi:hypothetical protein
VPGRRLEVLQKQVADFMTNNLDYYINKIELDKQPLDIEASLKEGKFTLYLAHRNQIGSDFFNVTLDAISNLYGIDFEIYSPRTGFIPYFIQTTYNRVEID